MKRYYRIMTCLLAVAIMAHAAVGQDTGVRDTLYYGDHGKAYGGYPGNLFRIPICIATDQQLAGIQFMMEYNTDALCPTWDSLSKCNSIMAQGNYLDMGVWMETRSVDEVCPDSIGIAGVSMYNHLPVGSYKFYDVWFTGGTIGQQVTVDTAVSEFNPGWYTVFASPGGGIGYTPECVGGVLSIVQAPIEFEPIADEADGEAGTTIEFSAQTTPDCIPVTITLDSIVNNATGTHVEPLPPTSGTNPLTVEWTTAEDQYGVWTAHFTATDVAQNILQFSTEITVYAAGDPCDEARGDADCDDMIDIDDVVYLVAYIFQGGPPPGCGEGK